MIASGKAKQEEAEAAPATASSSSSSSVVQPTWTGQRGDKPKSKSSSPTSPPRGVAALQGQRERLEAANVDEVLRPESSGNYTLITTCPTIAPASELPATTATVTTSAAPEAAASVPKGVPPAQTANVVPAPAGAGVKSTSPTQVVAPVLTGTSAASSSSSSASTSSKENNTKPKLLWPAKQMDKEKRISLQEWVEQRAQQHSQHQGVQFKMPRSPREPTRAFSYLKKQNKHLVVDNETGCVDELSASANSSCSSASSSTEKQQQQQQLVQQNYGVAAAPGQIATSSGSSFGGRASAAGGNLGSSPPLVPPAPAVHPLVAAAAATTTSATSPGSSSSGTSSSSSLLTRSKRGGMLSASPTGASPLSPAAERFAALTAAVNAKKEEARLDEVGTNCDNNLEQEEVPKNDRPQRSTETAEHASRGHNEAVGAIVQLPTIEVTTGAHSSPQEVAAPRRRPDEDGQHLAWSYQILDSKTEDVLIEESVVVSSPGAASASSGAPAGGLAGGGGPSPVRELFSTSSSSTHRATQSLSPRGHDDLPALARMPSLKSRMQQVLLEHTQAQKEKEKLGLQEQNTGGSKNAASTSIGSLLAGGSTSGRQKKKSKSPRGGCYPGNNTHPNPIYLSCKTYIIKFCACHAKNGCGWVFFCG